MLRIIVKFDVEFNSIVIAKNKIFFLVLDIVVTCKHRYTQIVDEYTGTHIHTKLNYRTRNLLVTRGGIPDRERRNFGWYLIRNWLNILIDFYEFVNFRSSRNR